MISSELSLSSSIAIFGENAFSRAQMYGGCSYYSSTPGIVLIGQRKRMRKNRKQTGDLITAAVEK